MPFSSHVGISRKIEARSERARLREMARDLLDEDSGGLIVRTVGEELTKSALKRELKTLQKTWAKIGRRAESLRAPALAHEETHLTSGIIRDQFSQKIDLLTVDSRDLAHEVKSYVGQVNPELLGRVKAHRGKRPIFDKFGVEEEIRRAFNRKVVLPSGGHIIIEQAEALVAIDVNTLRRSCARTWMRPWRSAGSCACGISEASSLSTSSTWMIPPPGRMCSSRYALSSGVTGPGPRCFRSAISASWR
jgi:ribonuclease G